MLPQALFLSRFKVKIYNNNIYELSGIQLFFSHHVGPHSAMTIQLSCLYHPQKKLIQFIQENKSLTQQ